MARYSDIARGTKARHPVALPLGDGPLPRPELAEDGTLTFPKTDDVVVVDVRVLSGAEQGDCMAFGRQYAEGKGVEAPKRGDELYDLGVMAKTIAIACLDHDSTEPAPFFDGGAEQVLTLDNDRIAFLYEAICRWMDLCSPRLRNLSPEEYVAGVALLANEDEEGEGTALRFFEQLGPGLQWTYARTLARAQWTSRTLKSGSSSTTEPSGLN